MYLFMFEIVLKRDYEDFYFFREFEVNGVTNNPSVGPPAASQPRNHSIPAQAAAPLRYDSPLRSAAFKTRNSSKQPRSSVSKQDLGHSSISHGQSIHSASAHRSFEPRQDPRGGNPKLVVTSQSEVNGVLMPTRMLYISPSRQEGASPPREDSHSGGKGAQVTRIVQGHLMPIRDANRGHSREHYLEDAGKLQREFGQPQKSVSGRS